MKPPLCSGCPLESSEGYCEGEGPDDASTLLLGEALGYEETVKGRPFVGGAGRTLNVLLQKAGVRRSELYITNVIRCRPPKNRTPSEVEIRECTKRHNLPLLLLRFNFVVLMGNVALFAVTGKTHVSRWRGSVFLHDGVKVMPTFHPAAIMRQQEMIPIAIADFTKIGREGWTSEYTALEQDYNLDAHYGHLAEVGVDAVPFAFDVETKSLEPSPDSIVLLGLCRKAGKAYVFKDIQSWHGLSSNLRVLFRSGALKIGHNIIFDISHLEANGIPVAKPWFDTMLAHHLVLSDVPNDLGFVSSLYTRVPYWKDKAKSAPEFYNATDVDVTFQLYETLSHEIKQKGLTRVFNTTMAVLPVLTKMHDEGVRVNTRLQLKWRIALERKIKKLETSLTKAVGSTAFNWRSHRQLSELLYKKMKLPPVYSKYSQKPTTNEEALKELQERTGSKIVKALLTLRKLSKLASTYFTPVETKGGRVYSQYLLHGTATGRLSSRGPNLQNVPKGPARTIYIPEDGNVFVSADYSQIELRIAALLANETNLLRAFVEGEDIHKRVACDVYKVRPTEVTERQRHHAKMIVYGLGYGRGARSLARQLKLSVSSAQFFIDKYFAAYPRIRLHRQTLVSEVSKDGYLTNPYGRRRYFFGPSVIPKVYNFLPQSTAADILLEALVRLDVEIPKGTRLVLTVHDSVMVECSPGQVKQVEECLHDVMEAPVDVLGGYVFPIDVKVGKTWEETG